MIATHLGFYNTSSTRTHVRFQFSTHAAAGGNVAPNSAFEAADLRIYRANDGAAFSATQRSSANGITMTSPFDSLAGFHDVDIDLTDNTDAGFYAAGFLYSVVLAPDETIDGQTITGVVLAYFEVGVQPANVTQFGGTAGTFASGRPEVNATHIGGSAISQASGVANVNVTQISGDSAAADNLEAAADGTGFNLGGGQVVAASVTGAVGSVTGNVGGNVAGSVGSVAAGGITAASLAADTITAAKVADGAFTAAKFASGAFDAVWSVATRTLTAFGFSVTVGANNDKTGYALSAAGVQAIWDALTSALTAVGSIGKLLVDNINATISSRSSHSAADVWSSGSRTLTSAANITSTGGTTVPQTGDSFARLGAPAGASIAADIATRATPAQVNAEVVDALSVDTYPEPGQGAPAATLSIAAKLGYVFKSWRNKKDNNGTETKLYADDGTTVDQKQTTSESGGTVTKGEWTTGA